MPVVLAIGAAVAYGVGVVLQYQAAQQVEGRMLELVRQPAWLAGIAVNGAGFALRFFALRDGSLVVVQAIVLTGVVFAVPVDAVMARRRVQAATVARYESMGHRDVKVVEQTADDDSLQIVSSRVVDVDLPSFAKKVLKPTNTMVQTDEWSGDGDSWKGSFSFTLNGAPVKINGTMQLDAEGDKSTHAVTINMDVKVPLVGGKIADWIGKNDATRTLAAEFAAGDEWLREHPEV